MTPPVMVDAGVIIRGLVAADPAGQRANAEFQRSAELLRRVARGDVQITMTDAAIAETATVLVSPRHFRLPRQDAAHRMRALLSHSGVRISGRAAVLAALDRWAADPAVGFSRALTIERAAEARIALPGAAEHLLPVADPGEPDRAN